MIHRITVLTMRMPQQLNSPDAATSGAAQASEKRNYKKTLNLPKTSFPMKANLVQNEPATIKRWSKANLAQKIREQSETREVFVFHDGPPYANGSIHLGHLLNKCLKDFVVRSRLMMGMRCEYIPGWDCHGLPIEHKVMAELVDSGKMEKLASLEDDVRRMAIRNECQKSAKKFVKLQTGQMQRLLTHAEYDKPYLTMMPAYEGKALETFAQLVEKGLVYRALKPVHWSPANETALAEAELEYYDKDDLSVYVLFAVEDADALCAAFGIDNEQLGGKTPSFMIWTTTPWTLPANMAIAVHPRVEYSLVKLGETIAVAASELIEKVAELGDGVAHEVLAQCKGSALTGLVYAHPLTDRQVLAETIHTNLNLTTLHTKNIYTVVEAEYVTTEDGTGLVHTAPGHGADDYNTGMKNNLPIYCPVQADGTYDDSVPDWLRGKDVLVQNINKGIAQRLDESGSLYHQHTFTHSYPHDWRGKTPVIFRATEQWFIGVDLPVADKSDTMRSIALQATDDITFVPGWGKNRLRAMLEQRPDWCISRQRSWGLPIPAFRISYNKKTFMPPGVIRAVAKVIREEGSDAWWKLTPTELLKHYSKNDWEKDLEHEKKFGPRNSVWKQGIPRANLKFEDVPAHLEKMHDIFDVWYESGVSWASVLEERGVGAPADLYLEGSDQHRGWFQSSLLTSVGATGNPPYKTLLTHGFIVNKDGHKMSKSLGNTLEVEELMKDFGADVARWWVSSLAYENDIKVDLEFIRTAGESYRKVRNTVRFLLSNLSDFVPAESSENFVPTSLEAWVLGELDALVAKVTGAFESYDFKSAHAALYDFCNDTLSAVYLTAVKDRLYCDAPDSPRRRQTQTVLWEVTEVLCTLLAPLMPHTADEAYRALLGTDDADVSIHLQTIPDPRAVPRDDGWGDVMQARDAGLLALEQQRSGGVENPLDCGLMIPDPNGVLARFDTEDIADLLGVSRIALDAGASEVIVQDLRDEPRCERSWKRDTTVHERSDGGMLSQRCAEAVGVA